MKKLLLIILSSIFFISGNSYANDVISKNECNSSAVASLGVLERRIPDEVLAAFRGAMLDVINTSKKSIREIPEMYEGEHIKGAAGHTYALKAIRKVFGNIDISENFENEFYSSEVSKYINLLTYLAKVESDEDVVGAVFNIEKIKVMFIKDKYILSANRTILGVKSILQCDFNNENAKIMFSRLGIKSKEDKLRTKNTLQKL